MCEWWRAKWSTEEESVEGVTPPRSLQFFHFCFWYPTFVLLWKRFTFFPKKSELPKFILQVKISWLNFSVVSGVAMKNLQRSEQVHFLVLWLCPYSVDFVLIAIPHALMLQRDKNAMFSPESSIDVWVLSNVECTSLDFTLARLCGHFCAHDPFN